MVGWFQGGSRPSSWSIQKRGGLWQTPCVKRLSTPPWASSRRWVFACFCALRSPSAVAVVNHDCVHQVHKLLIVVELLLGEIPDRLQFRQPSLKRSLMPYFLLTQGNSLQPLSSCLTPASKDCVMINMNHLNRIYNLNHHITIIVLMKSVVRPSYQRLRGRIALDVVQERSECWIMCVY